MKFTKNTSLYKQFTPQYMGTYTLPNFETYLWMYVFGNREDVNNVFLIEDLFVLHIEILLSE